MSNCSIFAKSALQDSGTLNSFMEQLSNFSADVVCRKLDIDCRNSVFCFTWAFIVSSNSNVFLSLRTNIIYTINIITKQVSIYAMSQSIFLLEQYHCIHKQTCCYIFVYNKRYYWIGNYTLPFMYCII